MGDDQASLAVVGKVFKIIKPLIIKNRRWLFGHNDNIVLLVLNMGESGMVTHILSEDIFWKTEGDKKH